MANSSSLERNNDDFGLGVCLIQRKVVALDFGSAMLARVGNVVR